MFKYSGKYDSLAKAIQKGDTDKVQEKIRKLEKGGKQISGKRLGKLTKNTVGSEHLTLGQNLRVLKDQFRAKKHLNPVNWGKAGWKEMGEQGGHGWLGGSGTKMRHMPLGAKAMTLGFLVPSIAQVPQKEDPTGGGRSRTERAGEVLGGLAGGVAATLPQAVTKRLTGVGGMVIPLAAGVGGFMAGEYLGGKGGKQLDKILSSRKGVAAGDSTAQDYENMKKTSEFVTRKPTLGAY
jgi:hypothetical protein